MDKIPCGIVVVASSFLLFDDCRPFLQGQEFGGAAGVVADATRPACFGVGGAMFEGM